MLSTKIRTTIAVLAAGLSVAVVTGPIAPVAHASKNTGAYQRSSEAFKNDQRYCDYMWGQFEGAVNKAGAAYQAGDKAAMNSWLNEAKTDLDTAKQGGCDWAMRVAPPTPPMVAPASAGNLAS